MRRVLVVLLLVVLVGCLGLPLVGAETTQFGDTTTGTGIGGLSVNSLYGKLFSTSLWASDVYFVENGSAHFTSGVACNVKFVIVDGAKHIIAVSDALHHNSGACFENFTFSSAVYLYKSMSNYTLCLISDTSSFPFDQSVGGNAYLAWDGSNSYDNPSDPEQILEYSNANNFKISLTITAGDAPTPTPTLPPVSPTPTMPPFHPPSVTPPAGGGGSSSSPSGNDGSNTDLFGSGFYWIFLVLGSVVAFLFGLFALLGDKGNRAVNVLIAVVSLVVFVVVLFAIGVL